MTCGGISAREYLGAFCIEARSYQRAHLRRSDWMAFRRSFGRAFGVLILALTPWILLAIGVYAQAPPNLPPPGAYQSIPNFTGVGAGVQFRQAINDRLSGVQSIAPTIVRLAFANLPTEQDGALIYCTNCTKTVPCAGGGSGAWAMGQNGQWSCGAAGLSPTSDINFNAHKATNLASGAINGDALAFGQVGSQLGAYMQPSVRPGATTCGTFNTTSCIANKPVNTVAGDLLLFCAGMPVGSETVTAPTGFTQIRQDQGNGWTHNCFQKVATGIEPSTYTVGYTVAQFGYGILMDLGQAGLPDASSGSTGGAATSFSQAAPSATTPKDLMIVCATQIGPMTLTAPTANIAIANMGNELCWSYASAPATATLTSGTNFAWAVAQVAILPSSIQGAPALRDTAMGFTASAATGTPNYSSAAKPMTGYGLDGCFNVVAYGADPTGVLDNSAAFTAAYSAACANVAQGSVGAVCIPNGTYSFQAPWLAMCSSTNPSQEPDIVGASKNAVVLVNNIGHANAIGGGPLLELAGPTVVSSLGGAGTLISAGLTASGGNSFNWGTNPVLFNLDQILGDRALNGKTQLDIRVFFTTTSNAVTEYLLSSDGSAAPKKTGCGSLADGYGSCKGAFGLWLGSDGKLRARINTSVTGVTLSNVLASASALSANTTYMAELSYDGVNAKLYHGIPGGTSTLDASIAQTGTIVQRSDENLVLGAIAQCWSMVAPTNYWRGKMDSIQISSIARCTNGGGCAVPNAKLTGDSNTIFLENWSNVSGLPLVEPEYTNGQATDQNVHQSWMAMYNLGLGNAAGNTPILRDFSVVGHVEPRVGIHVTGVAPHIKNVGVSGNSYGIMLDNIADYGGSIDDVTLTGSVLPINIVGGLTPLTNLTITCGIACLETVGFSVKDATLLPPTNTQWGMILIGNAHIDNVVLDTENGGAFPAVQISNMAQFISPSVEIDDSFLAANGASVSPIVIDGIYGMLSIKNSYILHASGVTGPIVDVSKGEIQVGGTVGIEFENNSYDSFPEPSDTAGDSYASATDINGSVVNYAVLGGGSTRQTTLTGTSAGTVVWSMPGEGSSYKRFVGHYTGYENTTATAQTITYPVAFSLTPKITSNDGPSGSTSTTALTLPASMSGPATGWIIIEGY